MLIYKQISKIMSELTAIEKNSVNAQQGFKFRSIDTVYNALHPLLAKYGVFTAPEVLSFERSKHTTRSGAILNYTIALIKYRFFAEDGSCVEITVTGEGSDAGDKSANKAMAVGHKYALLQVFCIPTEEPKDPDMESHEIAEEGTLPNPGKGWG